jgi:oxygen-independent coproporphyrinogen-3 oxidase
MARPFTALYVHVPFCAAKCGYCAFYSLAQHGPQLRRAYAERLTQELAAWSPLCATLESVYVGGGTPSVLDAGELEALLRAVQEQCPVAAGAEFTVECNPESVDGEKAALMAGLGVNRVSLGVQSFHPHLRRVLKRLGDPERASAAFEALRTAGIANVGLDLIYAIPGESLDDWEADLRRACSLGTGHLSAYELTVEEGTRLAVEGTAAAAEDQAAQMWEEAARVAGEWGLELYEVSNLARSGCECRHNQHVWHGGTYLGCGPAAASFDGEERRTNPADLKAWLDGAPAALDRLGPRERAAEVLAVGLRTVRGWRCDEFCQATGQDLFDLAGGAIDELTAEGLLEAGAEGVRPTQRGLLFADYVARRLI